MGRNAAERPRNAHSAGNAGIRNFKESISGRVSGIRRSAAERRSGASRKAKNRTMTVAERKEAMMKFRIRMGIIAGILIAIIVWYSVVAGTYHNKFLPNTTINGHDVSEEAADHIEEVLKDSVEGYSLELGFIGGQNEVIKGSDIGLSYVSSGEAEEILRSQKRIGWLRSKLGKKSTYSVKTSFRFDQAKLHSFLLALPEFSSPSITSPKNATVIRNPNGTFHVATEIEGNELDETAVTNAVTAAINASKSKLNLYNVEGAYKKPAVRSDDEALNAHAEELNTFAQQTVTIYRRNNLKTTVRPLEIAGWVSYNEAEDRYYVDRDALYEKCYAKINEIAVKDNDIHTTAKFKPRNYAEVTIPCGDYGYEIDVGDEADRLCDTIMNHSSDSITMENSIKETIDTTFGGTYVEVDITNQHVYYYENGDLRYDTDCVTGREYYYERRTPSGIFSVLALDRDVTLGSYNAPDPSQRYESHVDYWMPFYESYGMHDADWRDEDNFGGEIYQSYGSHGCVNLPPYAAAELYDMLEPGVPLVVCREGDNAPEGTPRGDLTFNAPSEGLVYE